jgi:hypothetical protein
MATLATAARNAACNGVVDLLDVGTTNASARIQLCTAANAVVATLVMSNPAFGNAATGVATANAITADSSAAGNASSVTYARFNDRDAAEVYRATVTGVGGGGEIEIAGGTTIGAGAEVSCSSLTHTQPV